MAGKLITGLIGYSMKKEFLGEAIYYRTTQNFDYELYATDLTGWSPSTIQTNVYNDFRNRYSGDIFVSVFNVPAETNSIYDSVRVQKYNVSVGVKSTCSGVAISQPELNTPYYTGLGSSFWNIWGISLLDFKEGFSIEIAENGNFVYGHDLSFMLLTGTRIAALQVASGVFSTDKNTNFGIAIPGIASIADTSIYLDYFTEVFDQTKQTYQFSKKREVLPITGGNAPYDLKHSLELKEDGTYDISEHADIKARKSFDQAQTNVDTLLAGSYTRCNNFYNTYNVILNGGSNPLINTPVRINKNYNRQTISADYDVSYTSNPQFKSNGTSVEELLDLSCDDLNIVTIKHRVNFSANRRRGPVDFSSMLTGATGSSPTTVNSYYSNQGTLYKPSWPMKQLKVDFAWPWRGNKANISLEYSNSPKYFVTINGIPFNYIDSKVASTNPIDIINEYKIVNRPTRTSVLNYAYQTEKGQIVVTVEGGLGRNANEFQTGFRTGYYSSLLSLYKYGIGVFMSQFNNIIPNAFTYYLSDLKYSLNQDGILNVTLTFTYTLKKYMM